MSTRPEVLFPLFGSLTKLDGIGPKTAQNFETMGIEKPRDLLFTLPYAGVIAKRAIAFETSLHLRSSQLK